MEVKHCVNCEGFAWWDGDFCCTTKMKLLEGCTEEKPYDFWTPLSDTVNAEQCEDYVKNETDNCYETQYINFLEEYYELSNVTDKKLILKELGYKHYERDSNGNLII